MEEKKPTRKLIRLAEYDYGSPGGYFITVCTKDKRCLFWENVGTGIASPPRLTPCGMLAEQAILNIPWHYPGVTVDKYTIMPNHLHLILRITCDENGRALPVPTVSTIIQQMKGFVTKRAGFRV